MIRSLAMAKQSGRLKKFLTDFPPFAGREVGRIFQEFADGQITKESAADQIAVVIEGGLNTVEAAIIKQKSTEGE